MNPLFSLCFLTKLNTNLSPSWLDFLVAPENLDVNPLKNDDILCKSTKNSIYLLDVVPAYQIEEDSRDDYEDSWFVMEKQLEEKDGISINVSSEDSIN